MSAPSAAPGARLPTFFIIGAPKAGTTSLHAYLDQHPQIQMSAVKEPGFLACDGPERDNRKVHRLDRYERLFDPAVAVRGEASTSYSEYPRRRGVPERIARLVPDARFIYCVRDPVARTVSHYHQLVATAGESRSLEQALSDLSDPCYPCVCASRYGQQMEQYLRTFPAERMLVVDQTDMLNDRDSTLARIFSFLGVDSTFRSPLFGEELLKSEGRRTYPPGVSRFIAKTVRPNTRWLAPGLRRALRGSFEQRFLPTLEVTEPDEELRCRLSELFSGEAARLRELTGEAFASWSV